MSNKECPMSKGEGLATQSSPEATPGHAERLRGRRWACDRDGHATLFPPVAVLFPRLAGRLFVVGDGGGLFVAPG